MQEPRVFRTLHILSILKAKNNNNKDMPYELMFQEYILNLYNPCLM